MKKIKKKNNKSKKYRIYENLFVGFSIFIILVIIGIYAYRTIYYYKKENYVAKEAKLVDIIFNPIDVVYTGDGLYKKNNEYYFSGKSVNNYLYFSGRMWRIIGLDDTGIKLITDDSQTSLIWGDNVNFDESKIYDWLNKDVFIRTISDKDKLVDGKWCNNSIDINKYDCKDTTTSLVGLITTHEYIRSGGVNSYLNIDSYFWTLNISQDKKAYYVHNSGGLNNDIGNNDSLYSYGVRPVIYLNKDIVYTSGKGTMVEPYIIIDNNDIKISNHDIGNYVLYNNYKFRIMDKSDEYTKIILDGYILNDNNEPVKVTYNNVMNYLNNNFINKFNKDKLIKTKYYVTEYNSVNNYDYNSKLEEIDSYVSIPNVSDIFLSEYSDVWLNTYNNKGQGLIYKTTSDKSIMADLVGEENYIRPVVAISNDLVIIGGKGTKEEPYIIGDNK